MIKRIGILIVITAILVSGPIMAKEENEGYIGLQWKFGGKFPSFVIGYRDADVATDGDTDGFDVSISFDIGLNKVNKISVKGFSGDENAQAEAGFGYSLVDKTLFVRLGGQGKYVSFNVDYLFKNKKLDFELGVNSIGEYDVPVTAGPPPMMMSLER